MRHGIKGFLLALVGISILAFASGPLLSKDTLRARIAEAFASGTLGPSQAHPYGTWTDCVQFGMMYVTPDTAIGGIDTRWIRPPDAKPCEQLKALVSEPPPVAPPYVSYASGARHIEALLLTVMPIGATMALFTALTYVSILALVLCAFAHDRRIAARVVVPIAIYLAFGFGLHEYASNTMWSPAIFCGLFALAGLIGLPQIFEERNARLMFFGFLGALVAYLDYLQGALPALLSLTIVLNGFFYGRKEGARDVFAIIASFVLAFAALTAIRLLALGLIEVGVWQQFVANATPRISQTATWSDVAARLWAFRGDMTGSMLVADLMIAAGALGWLVAIFEARRAEPTGLAVLALASGGLLLWYVVFPSHTIIHPWLMVRLLALPCAYGIAATCLLIPAGQGRWLAAALALPAAAIFLTLLLASAIGIGAMI